MENAHNQFLLKYKKEGNNKFYKSLIFYAVEKLASESDSTVDMELLTFSEVFLLLYRRECNDEYLIISSIFRKSAHKIYRLKRKKNPEYINIKFLNLVKK